MAHVLPDRLTTAQRLRSGLKWLATGVSVAAASYVTYAGVRWYRYGDPQPPADGDEDPLLDRYMPVYEVVERHQIQVAAPPEITFAAAREMDLRRSSVTGVLMKGRAVVMGARDKAQDLPPGVIEMATALGWGVLAETPGREIVVGAVTQPWRADVVFRSVPPEEFEDFQEPGYVKIAWTLRVDPLEGERSLFRTETRATTTDAASRAAFRRYWSLFSPGIVLIRRTSVGLVKVEAERRAAAGRGSGEGHDVRAGLTAPPGLGSG